MSENEGASEAGDAGKAGEELEFNPSPEDSRRERIFNMRLAGASTNQIAKRENIHVDTVVRLLNSVLKEPAPSPDQMRTLENARLDMLQMPMIKAAREGNVKAVQAYLRISERRARMNGLDAPRQIAVAANVRIEMEQQLQELENVLITEPLSEEIARDYEENREREYDDDEYDELS